MGCKSSKSQNISKESKPKSTTDTQNQSQDDEYVEDVVCSESEIKENEMKVVDIKDAGKVLLVRQKGKIHALGTKCTHYGAPLVNGALGDGRVRCQWHGACFNIETGDIEDFPGLDSLPCHQVIIQDCKVKVRAKRSALQNPKRIKSMEKSKNSDQHFVVIGGGPAGAICVETLRQENFNGSITLVCKENHLPYDRVKISKIGDFDIEKNQFRTSQFYSENNIDVIQGVAAYKIDTESKEIYLDNGNKVHYNKVFIATGSTAINSLNVPGNNLKNIITLRDYEDGKRFVSLLTPDTDVVINGSSFIAMESAACCADNVKSVTIVSRSKVPFKNSLGEEIGRAFVKLFESKGIKFCTNTNIKEIIDDGEGNVGCVELEDGTKLKANVLLLGIGSKFNTNFLENSSINIKTDGSIEVDEYLKTNIDDVYAGGDIAFAPIYSHNNQKSAIGHFSLAHYHGKIAALNMLGKNEKLKSVPYFWTSLFGKSVRYAGHGKFEDVIYTGNVEELKFVAFYIDGNGEVVAASSCGMDPIVSKFAELLYQGKKLFKKDIEEDPLSWVNKILP